MLIFLIRVSKNENKIQVITADFCYNYCGFIKMLEYQTIISSHTHYGVIWSGQYGNQDCIMKVVLLNTGIHYDKLTKKYLDHNAKISKGKKYFKHDDRLPFLHTMYTKRKSMSIEKFNHEVSMLKQISALKLAPKLYDSWIDQKTFSIHYGIIVMQRMATTVKDIILKRDLTPKELEYIMSKIQKLHGDGIKHGDLKPSNIGVNVDESGTIKEVRMIDWAKGAGTQDSYDFERDLRTFSAHIKKNIAERI
jgi:tRNA A-37 threonylcarbamoyl transferase component Bud32